MNNNRSETRFWWMVIAAGVLVILVAAILRTATPYWASWTINAIGWLCIAMAVLAFSDRQKKSLSQPSGTRPSASGQIEQNPVLPPRKKQTGGNNMRYGLAIIACAGVWFIYGLIGATLNWQNAGGVIPVLILLAVTGIVWRSITAKASRPGESPDSKPKR